MSFPADKYFIKPGRINAISTVAAAFIPIDFIKISIPRPNKKAETKSNQFGVSRGSKRTNRI